MVHLYKNRCQEILMIANNIKFSNEKAKKDLNYKTRDIRKTIKDTVNFYKNDYNS